MEDLPFDPEVEIGVLLEAFGIHGTEIDTRVPCIVLTVHPRIDPFSEDAVDNGNPGSGMNVGCNFRIRHGHSRRGGNINQFHAYGTTRNRMFRQRHHKGEREGGGGGGVYRGIKVREIYFRPIEFTRGKFTCGNCFIFVIQFAQLDVIHLCRGIQRECDIR